MKRSVVSKFLGTLAGFMLLLAGTALNANGQSWVSTATKAYPIQYTKNATLIGSLPSSTPMHIVVGLQEQNASQVQPTLKRMVTPGDALYGTSLTLAEFVAEFGPTSTQVQAVESYLTGLGFTNVAVEPNQLLVKADGTAANVEAAFNTSLSQYSVNGETVFVNTKDAQVPSSLQGIVVAVLGLNNIVTFHMPLIANSPAGVPSTDPCTPPACPVPAQPLADTAFGPIDYQIAYDVRDPGSDKQTSCCVSIASIAEGNVSQVVTDLADYETNYNLPKVPVTVVNAGIPSPDTSGQIEWDLDSQTSSGIAQRVERYYFYVATSLTDSDLGLAINRWVEDRKAKILSISLGECEFFPYLDGAMLLDDEMFAEAALQGQTAFASSDDQGSACPVEGTNGVPLSGPPDTSYPASSPYVISTGGTQLYTNANFTYDFEVGAYFSGGGPSYFENPGFWQSYTGSGTLPIVPSAAVNSEVGCPMGCRGVPDVSMCADPNICGAIIYISGVQTCCYGGTSLASPLAMGAWARLECLHSTKLGFAGPLIYQLANGGPTPSSPYFNDVILGGNGLFTTLPGYDYVTGLGSFDITAVSAVIPSSYPQ